MKQNRIFSTPTYESVVETVSKNTSYLVNGYFTTEVVPVGILALKDIPKEQQQKFCDFVDYVDRHFVVSTKNVNLYHKIPTIVAGSIYFTNYYDMINHLTVEEVSILAKYSITQPISFYEQAPAIFTKDVLGTVARKTPDFFARDDLMYLVEEQFSQDVSKEAVIGRLTEESLDLLLQESFMKEEEQVKKELQNEGRRF